MSLTPCTVAVIFGGKSSERTISQISSTYVIKKLIEAGYEVKQIGITKDGRWFLTEASCDEIQTDKWATLANNRAISLDLSNASSPFGWRENDGSESKVHPLAVDVVFPVLHGKYGEDGTIQGLFEIADVAYVGCGVLASAVCMDKVLANQVFRDAGLPHVDWVMTTEADFVLMSDQAQAFCKQAFVCGKKLFVKPANAGSSVAITLVADVTSLNRALALAAQHDKRIIIEHALNHPREIEVAVMEQSGQIITSVCGEICPQSDFYDFDAKYKNNTSKLIVPAIISEDVAGKIQKMARQVFSVVDGKGLMRVDFFLQDEEIWLNEANTLPGFTAISMYPQLFAATGIDGVNLVKTLVNSAVYNHQLQSNRRGAGEI